jgi:hypothetical protein
MSFRFIPRDQIGGCMLVFNDDGGVLGRRKVMFSAALTELTPATEVGHE